MAFTIVFGFIAVTLTAHVVAGHVLYTNNGVPLFAFALPIIVLLGGVFCVAGVCQDAPACRTPACAGRPLSGTITHCDIIEEIIEDKR